MAKIALHALLTAADGKAAELEAAVENLVAASAEEAGLEVYAACVDTSDPNKIHFFEVYTDDAAVGAHGSGEAMKAAMEPLTALLDGGPAIAFLRPFAAKGIEL